MRKINQILDILFQIAEGQDYIEEGAVGFAGYSFIFFNQNHEVLKTHFSSFSSKVCCIGALRGSYEKLKRSVLGSENVNSLEDLLTYDFKYDLLLAGALKTLVPSLRFGGYETFYEVALFAKTPDNKFIPAMFYWGVTGTSLGSWRLEDLKELNIKLGNILPPGINITSPFDFSKEEEDEFIEALTCALDKVPVSDFQGIFDDREGISKMGVQSGNPFITQIDDRFYWYDEDTDILKKIKKPSKAYREKFWSLQDIVEEELRVLESNCPHYFKSEDQYDESEDNESENIPHFETFLWGIHVSLTVRLEELEEYKSEKVLNKPVYKDTSTLKNEEISRLAKVIINREIFHSFLVHIDIDNNFKKSKINPITKAEKMRAIYLVERVLFGIFKSYCPLDIQYFYLKKLKDYYKIKF